MEELEMTKHGLSDHEPDPTESAHPAVYDLIRKDLDDRDKYGEQKYGVRLQPFNGRNALKDSYQEVMDLLVYTRQALYEQDQHRETLKKALFLLREWVQKSDWNPHPLKEVESMIASVIE
jgi:hypothetical protein